MNQPGTDHNIPAAPPLLSQRLPAAESDEAQLPLSDELIDFSHRNLRVTLLQPFGAGNGQQSKDSALTISLVNGDSATSTGIARSAYKLTTWGASALPLSVLGIVHSLGIDHVLFNTTEGKVGSFIAGLAAGAAIYWWRGKPE